MKKLCTMLLAVAALLTPSAVHADKVTVTSATDLISQFTKARTAESSDTIYVVYTADGMNMKTIKADAMPSKGKIYMIGVNDEASGAKACVKFEMNIAANTEGDHLSLIFQNLVIKDYNGASGNSKHLINAKDANFHYIDTLAFRNCEITDFCRTIYRLEPQAKADGTKDAGEVKSMEFTNCTFHYGSTQTSAMAMLYLGQKVAKLTFRNNTFYDLPHLNSIATFAYMTAADGRDDIDFTFENNTVIARSKIALFGFDSYVGQSSTFNIHNNLFLKPNWTDDLNNNDLTADSLAAYSRSIANIQYGMVYCQGNVFEGYSLPVATADADGNVCAFLDTKTDSLSMSDVSFAWTDMVDVQNDLFGIYKGHKLYTAGFEGKPIGDLNNYTDVLQKAVTVTATVSGSKSAVVKISPAKSKYLTGDVVTLTADTNLGLNTFKGWSTGSTDKSIVVTLTDNLNVTANFEEIPYIAAWNLQQLTGNNQKLTGPLAPNFGEQTYSLAYLHYDATTKQYADSTTNAFMTRNNKVTGDERNCFFLHTDSATFSLDGAGQAEAFAIKIPAVVKGSKLMFNVATDNICYKKYAISYTTDNINFTEISQFSLAEVGKWQQVEATIPDALEGKAVSIVVKGVESEGKFITADFQALIDADAMKITTEYLFVSELYLVNGTSTGIETLRPVQQTVGDNKMYDLSGRRITAAKGLYIMNGKKFIK